MKYVFLVPSIILLALFTLWPLAELGIMSFYRTDFIASTFVGFKNYIDIFKSGVFFSAGLNSLLYIFWLNILTVVLPMAIALWIWRLPKKWLDVSRIFFYLPSLSAGLIISQLWKNFFHIGGPINQIIGLVGIEPIRFFSDRVTAISTIAIIISLSSSSGNLIITLASISAINKDIFDAAQIDGAGWGKIAMKIVIPHLVTLYGILSLLSAIGACQIFETIQWLAPFEYASTMTHRIWLEAFQFSRHGSAAAMAVVFIFIMAGMAMAKNRIAKESA